MAAIEQTAADLALSVKAVNVGRPQEIGIRAGAAVISAIRKAPVDAARLKLNLTNLDGDAQADLGVHGGADKAVYVYAAAHWPLWEAEHGLVCGPGIFGENLTVAGATEDNIRIGDVFSWGPAHLQVSQPRQPCYKLSMHLSREDIAPAMVMNGRSGWYMRVLRPGVVPVKGGVLQRQKTNPSMPTVGDVFRSHFDPRTPRDRLIAYANCLELASAWREAFAKRLRNRTGQ